MQPPSQKSQIKPVPLLSLHLALFKRSSSSLPPFHSTTLLFLTHPPLANLPLLLLAFSAFLHSNADISPRVSLSFQHMKQLKGPHCCLTATLAPLSGNEDAVASCSLRSSSWRLTFLQQEFETGNYCWSCSFFLSLRDGIKHTDALWVWKSPCGQLRFTHRDPRFKALTHLWPAFSSANRAEMQR